MRYLVLALIFLLQPSLVLAQVSTYTVPSKVAIPTTKGSGVRGEGANGTQIQIYAPEFSTVISNYPPEFLIECNQPVYRVTVTQPLGPTIYDRTFSTDRVGRLNLVKISSNQWQDSNYRLAVTIPDRRYYAKVVFKRETPSLDFLNQLNQIKDPELKFQHYYQHGYYVDAVAFLFKTDRLAFVKIAN
ncbi:hypothetical protein [Merismopedia glauca]|uniref:DUF928 domain-containing protein n=1 Tax=Merismopedia glauca CCAP 1448/3 TaxID=1296344 RepID=A0A2T1BZB3_9CYAN|nr:hypothetical protein [Merismopedia glauca]PSB01366.1 hypothetical protein C7B64_18695 [Merismopedia glauca CCAP 1448/3]